jgi:hypothetical protein
VDLVALVELYSVERLLEACPLLGDASSSWHGRRTDWQKHASVELDKSTEWLPLLGFIAARNAFQHGDGRLTRQQLDKYRDDNLLHLRAAGIHRNGDMVEVGPADVERCLTIALRFIDFVELHL